MLVLEEEPVRRQVEDARRVTLRLEPAFEHTALEPGLDPEHPRDLLTLASRPLEAIDGEAERSVKIARAAIRQTLRSEASSRAISAEVEVGVCGHYGCGRSADHRCGEAEHVATAVDVADIVVLDQEASVVGTSRTPNGSRERSPSGASKSRECDPPSGSDDRVENRSAQSSPVTSMALGIGPPRWTASRRDVSVVRTGETLPEVGD